MGSLREAASKESGGAVASGFKINKQAIRKMSKEIEREFAKNPVRVPIEVDHQASSLPAATTVNNYHGPVVTVNGDQAQIAWNSDSIDQSQQHEQVAPGYEQLAKLLTDVLANLKTFPLEEAESVEVRTTANDILEELVKPVPEQSAVRRGVTIIKGLLAPIGVGLSKAATDATAESAREIIEALGVALPS